MIQMCCAGVTDTGSKIGCPTGTSLPSVLHATFATVSDPSNTCPCLNGLTVTLTHTSSTPPYVFNTYGGGGYWLGSVTPCGSSTPLTVEMYYDSGTANFVIAVFWCSGMNAGLGMAGSYFVVAVQNAFAGYTCSPPHVVFNAIFFSTTGSCGSCTVSSPDVYFTVTVTA